MRWIHKVAAVVTLASIACAGQDRYSLFIPSAAENVKKANRGVWFSPGCDTAKFTVQAVYPGTTVLRTISGELLRSGFTPTKVVNRRFIPRPSDSINRWESFVSVSGSKSHVQSRQWTSADGDLVSYSFGYFTDKKNNIDVEAESCPAAIVEKYRCDPKDARSDLKPSMPNVRIMKIEPAGRDFKVFFTVANQGDSPVLIVHEGEREDGSPDLWANVEQEENGKWGYVGSVCIEHPPFDHLVLNPGESIDSWAMAVDFPGPHHRFGMCSRNIAHLRGRIRVSLRAYSNACEVYDWTKAPRFFTSSDAVPLPAASK